jgi:CheY-like chemotaxis protein
MPIIFSAFEQGDMSLTRRFGGLGLGLTICKAFVEAQHGRIDAASAGTGQGATFGVEFPTVAPAPAPREIRPVLLQPKPARGRLHILVVEDHVGTMEAMARLLNSLGHEVKTAACVKEALAIAAREEIDLVISDLALPDGSGHDVMRLLKTRYNVKGIALSGFSMDEDLNRSRESGFQQHLTKPVALEQLEAAIENVVY